MLAWCRHKHLESLFIYDPAGALKERCHLVEEAFQGQSCIVQAGWREDPIGRILLCEECRSHRRSATASQSLPSAARAGATAAQLAGPAAATAVPCRVGGGGEAPAGFPAGTCTAQAQAQACSCPEDEGHLGGPGRGLCQRRRAVLAGTGTLSSGQGLGVAGVGTEHGACNGGGGLASGSGAAPVAANGHGERGLEASVQPPALPKQSGKAWPGGMEAYAEVSKQGPGAAPKNVCRGATPLASGTGAVRPHSAVTGSTPVARPRASEVLGPPGGPGTSRSNPEPCGAAASASAPSALEPRPLRVTLLSAEDGFAPILAAARTGGVCSGCGAALPLQGGPYREGLARLKQQVEQLAGPRALTEPELVLVVGPALTLAGYPPLAVAQSEVLHLGPAAALGRQVVDGALSKFLRTEQRFGR